MDLEPPLDLSRRSQGSNLRFTESGEAFALLDLDTMGYMPLEENLGMLGVPGAILQQRTSTMPVRSAFLRLLQRAIFHRLSDSAQREALPGGGEDLS